MEFKTNFTLSTKEYEGDPEYWQERQGNAVRQEAMTQGFRPTGEVSYDGAEEMGASTVLTYSLECEVAGESGEYEVEHAKVSEQDQEILEAALAAGVDPDKVDAKVVRENLSPEDAAAAVAAGTPDATHATPGVAEQKAEPSTGSEGAVGEQGEPSGEGGEGEGGSDAPTSTEPQEPPPGSEDNAKHQEEFETKVTAEGEAAPDVEEEAEPAPKSKRGKR